MTVEEVNVVLSNLNNLGSKYNKVSGSTPDDYWNTSHQGDTSKRSEIYRLDYEDLHLKVTYEVDSYAENESLVGIKFVKPVEKLVKTFE